MSLQYHSSTNLLEPHRCTVKLIERHNPHPSHTLLKHLCRWIHASIVITTYSTFIYSYTPMNIIPSNGWKINVLLFSPYYDLNSTISCFHSLILSQKNGKYMSVLVYLSVSLMSIVRPISEVWPTVTPLGTYKTKSFRRCLSDYYTRFLIMFFFFVSVH